MKKQFQPPAWVDTLIDRLAPPHLAEEIKGDLHELYLKDSATKGHKVARLKYLLNVLGFLGKHFFWKQSNYNGPTLFFMMSNYFKTAKRSLLARKGTTTINIIGLVVGIASALVIFFVVRFELSFDMFHSQSKEIYRIVRVSGEDMSEYRTGISYPVPRALEAEMPGLQQIASVEYFGGANVDILDDTKGTVAKFREEGGCVLLEPEFFDIFDFKDTNFKWLSGNTKTALAKPFTAVLTETIARKYFGERDPIGQMLRLQKQFDFEITGVIEDFPPNTDFPFTILLSYASLETLAGADQLSNWFSVNDTHCTYVVLSSGSNKKEAEDAIAKVHAAHTPKELHLFRHYLLQELSEVHYDTRFMNLSGRTISHNTITALTIIAIFLLLAGSINYINLATAQSALRSKEIGLRKVMGSNRTSLMLQFIIETFIVVSIAGIIALGLSEILLSNLQSMLNIKHSEYIFIDPFVLGCLMIIILVVTIFAGVYPSQVISRFNPLSALKNKFSTENIGGLSLRKMLVVVQFTITQMLVVGTFIVVSQMKYFQNVDMGFVRDAIVTTRVRNIPPDKLHVMEQQLRSLPFVSNVSFSSTLPSGARRNRSYQDLGLPEADSMQDFVVFEYEVIDPHFLDLYEIKILAGRNLRMEDSVRNILINKTLAKTLGLGSPSEALGKTLKRGDGKLFNVVGIVDDFYSNSMKEGVDNIAMFVNQNDFAAMSVKFSGGESLENNVREIEKIWTSIVPDLVFTYDFFDDNVRAFYTQEQKYAQLFQLFSAIFLAIGCLGLYGLITFVVNQKGKEVAIRKVLGANLSNILSLFSKEYIQLIVISFVIATPITYYVVSSWLNNFANRIPLKWWLFVVPGGLVLLIAFLVVSIKSFKAAKANPVDRLKYE